jgi:5-methylcytosine-specific restriction endonuclease McrA
MEKFKMSEITRFKLLKPKNVSTFTPIGQKPKKAFCKEFDAFTKLRSSERWQRLRVSVLTSEPLCRVCGCIAVEVHHIIEASKNADLFFEISNLAPVCEECHKKVHAAYRRGIAPEILFNQN